MNPTNFKEWNLKGFGEGICDLFLLPYNEKIWGCDLSEMNISWVKEFATINLEEIKDTIQNKIV